MERSKWIDRKFIFDIPQGWLPNILERLNGAISRLSELTADVSDADAGKIFYDKWSIKEHVGHLTDLEELHLGRVNDFVIRKPVLRAADMSNAKTVASKHNQKPLILLVNEFFQNRELLISQLEKLDDQTLMHVANHRRLKKKMSPVDMAFFVAEHDDHHMASIRMIKTMLNKK